MLGLTSPTATPKVSFHYSLDGAAPPRRRAGHPHPAHLPLGHAQRPAEAARRLDEDHAAGGPLTDGRELLVLVSPAPLLIPRIFDTFMQPVLASVFDVKSHILGTERYDPGDPTPPSIIGSEQYDLEGWGANEPAFNEFVRHLATYPRVVAIGGDVHFASSMACDVWTKAGGATAASRILQCTASAAKNQWSATLRAVIRGQRSAQKLLKGEPWSAWAGTATTGVLPPAASIRPGRRARLAHKPTYVAAGGWPPGTTLDPTKPMDVQLRIAALRDERADLGVGRAGRAGADDVERRVAATRSWPATQAVAAAHQQLLASPSDAVRLLVFGSNVGVVSFTPSSAGEFSATHAVYSPVGDGTTGSDFTHHSLDLTRPAAGAPPTLVAGG